MSGPRLSEILFHQDADVQSGSTPQTVTNRPAMTRNEAYTVGSAMYGEKPTKWYVKVAWFALFPIVVIGIVYCVPLVFGK